MDPHLKAAGAEEAAEQEASLGEQSAQEVSLHRSASHGAVQDPSAVHGQRAHVCLPVTPTNAVKDHVRSSACEIPNAITGNSN